MKRIIALSVLLAMFCASIVAAAPIDLTKRSELSRGLTNAEQDANLTAIETYINALLTGTSGYEAGNALKLGGVLASSHWNNNNCTKSISGNTGWTKTADGKLETWTAASVVAGGYIDVSLPVSHANSSYGIQTTVFDAALPSGARALSPGSIRVYAQNGTTVFIH